MEIIPFLRLTAMRIAVLFVAVGVVGGGAFMYARRLPVTYTAQTTVFLERVYPGLRYEREPFLANYESAVKNLADVRANVSEQTGISSYDLAANMTVVRPANSDLAYVKFKNTDPALAQTTSKALAKEALLSLTTSGVTAAQESLDRATQALAEGQAAVQAIAQQFGAVNLDDEYASINNQVKALEQQLASLADGPTRANVQSLLDFRRDQRTKIAAVLTDYDRAAARLTKLKAATDTAETALDTAKARLAVAQGDIAVVPQGATPESLTQKSIRYAAGGGVAAASLVLAAIMMLETLSRRRSSGRQPALTAAHNDLRGPAPRIQGASNGFVPSSLQGPTSPMVPPGGLPRTGSGPK